MPFSRIPAMNLSRLVELTRHVAGLEQAFVQWLEYVPAVMWCKDYRNDQDGRMLFMSREYVRVWPVQASNYVGKRDYDVWPPAIAEQFRRNDLRVLETGHAVEIEEDTPGASERGWERIHVVKFPIWCEVGPPARPALVGGIGLKLNAGGEIDVPIGH